MDALRTTVEDGHTFHQLMGRLIHHHRPECPTGAARDRAGQVPPAHQPPRYSTQGLGADHHTTTGIHIIRQHISQRRRVIHRRIRIDHYRGILQQLRQSRHGLPDRHGMALNRCEKRRCSKPGDHLGAPGRHRWRPIHSHLGPVIAHHRLRHRPRAPGERTVASVGRSDCMAALGESGIVQRGIRHPVQDARSQHGAPLLEHDRAGGNPVCPGLNHPRREKHRLSQQGRISRG